MIFLTSILLLSACGGSADAAARSAEDYVNALIAKDENQMVNLSCGAWEGDARSELSSFESVEVRMEGLNCQQTAVEGDNATVHCNGIIYATYSGEDRPIDLSVRDYVMTQEGGEWRMCGYK